MYRTSCWRVRMSDRAVENLGDLNTSLKIYFNALIRSMS